MITSAEMRGTHAEEDSVHEDTGNLDVMDGELVLQLTPELLVQEQIPLLESNEILIQDRPVFPRV